MLVYNAPPPPEKEVLFVFCRGGGGGGGGGGEGACKKQTPLFLDHLFGDLQFPLIFLSFFLAALFHYSSYFYWTFLHMYTFLHNKQKPRHFHTV